MKDLQGSRRKTAEAVLAEALRKSIEGCDVMNFITDQHFGHISIYQHNLPMIRTYRTLRIGCHELVLLPDGGGWKVVGICEPRQIMRVV